MEQSAATSEHTKELEKTVTELRSQLSHANKKIDEINDRLLTANDELTLKTLEVNELKEQLAAFKYRLFQRTAEKYLPSQPELFDSEESVQTPEEKEAQAEEPKTAVKSYERSKAGRKALPAELPRKEIIIDIPTEDKVCACGAKLVRIGEEVSERLQIIPAKIYIERTVRPKYACKVCEGSGDEDKPAVRIAPVPVTLIPHSIATPGMLSFVFTGKFCDHLPYYRQQAAFARQGIDVSRQDMSGWQEKVYEKLRPMEALMTSYLKTGPYIQMDETTCRVFGEPEREDTQKSYMWLARGGPVKHPVVIYRYYPTRGAAHIQDFITGYSGFLQTDGYEAYNTALSEHAKTNPEDHITHAGCLAHARRKFFDAAKASSSKSKSADEAMKYIRDIYRKETELREQNPEPCAFVAARRNQIVPMLKTFHEWLLEKAQHVPPSLALGKAVNYTLGQWEHITAYIGCPDLTPDNNAGENAIRPFVLGRKNWLFSGSPDGARSSCMMYSLIESAKENGLNPQEYLRCVFERAPFCSSTDDWQKLMPWNIQIEPFVDRGGWIN